MIDKEQMINDLNEEYKFIQKQIKEAKKQIKEEGLTTKSPANGAVRNPAVTIYNDLMKQQLNVNKQLKELSEWAGMSTDTSDELDEMIK